MANWRKLKIILVIQRMCKSSSLHQDRQVVEVKKPEKEKFDLNKFMRRFIISHDNYWLQYWNMFFGIIVLISIFDDAWIIAFRG